MGHGETCFFLSIFTDFAKNYKSGGARRELSTLRFSLMAHVKIRPQARKLSKSFAVTVTLLA